MPRRRPDRCLSATRALMEPLEQRRLLSGTLHSGGDGGGDDGSGGGTHVPPGNGATSGSFDIATFSESLPDERPASRSYDLAGLRFFSEAAYTSPADGTRVFGSTEKPAWTLIGRSTQGETFIPILLTYGTTQIRAGVGENAEPSFNWTGGLYTVANNPEHETVDGGVALQPGNGTIRIDDLLVSEDDGSVGEGEGDAANGAALPRGQATALAKQDENSTVDLGFTPSRVALLDEFAGSTPNPLPVIRLSGVHSVSYKGASTSFGIGGQSANQAKYLQIKSEGNIEFIDAGTGENAVVVTASFGGNAGLRQIQATSIVKGEVTTNKPHGLKAGTFIRFRLLEDSAGVVVGASYQIESVDGPNAFTIVDSGGNSLQLNAGNCEFYAELKILTIKRDGVVTTEEPHNLKPGDQIEFAALENEKNVVESRSYQVLEVPGPQEFTFGPSNEDQPVADTGATDSRVAVPLFQAGGFELGGEAKVVLSYDGTLGGTEPEGPPDFRLQINGDFSAAYRGSNGTTIAGQVGLGSIVGGSSDGLVIQRVDGEVSVPNLTFNLSGRASFGDSFSLALNNLEVSNKIDNGTKTTTIGGKVAITTLGSTVTGQLGDGAEPGLVITTDQQGERTLESVLVRAEYDRLEPGAGTLFGRIALYSGSIDFHYQKEAGPNDTPLWGLGRSAAGPRSPSYAARDSCWARGASPTRSRSTSTPAPGNSTDSAWRCRPSARAA